MKISDAFPSKYLSAKDVEEGDTLVLTIKDVEMETMGQGKDAQDKPVIYSREREKGFVVNKTNATTISKLYGDEMDDWLGKKIALYQTEVQGPNGMVPSLRVRSKTPTGPGKVVPMGVGKANGGGHPDPTHHSHIPPAQPVDDEDDSTPF